MKDNTNSEYNVGDLVYDAAIYDGMNTHMNDLEFYKRWLPKSKNARILELCCGTGRLTLPIAKDGFDISGVDFTASMLEKAREKASKVALDIKFIEADIRTLDLQKTYDLIFIPFNSIHQLYKNEDLFQTFATVKKHLKEDGLFILDCFNPNLQFIVESEKAQKEIELLVIDNDSQEFEFSKNPISGYRSALMINNLPSFEEHDTAKGKKEYFIEIIDLINIDRKFKSAIVTAIKFNYRNNVNICDFS